MKTGFKGTFVISWSQTELDGLWSAPLDALRVGTAWSWTGDAVRVDGPREILPLGDAMGEADLRKRAAHSVRRLLRAVEADTSRLAQVDVPAQMAETSFTVTDGRDTWTVTIIEGAKPTARLLMFVGEIPPRHVDLWVVSHNVNLDARDQVEDRPGGVICFTPGTMIRTDEGAKRIEDIAQGDFVQTKDNGCQEVLWTGRRRITGARLYAMPHLAPVRLRAGSLDEEVPDEGLLVSPDHRILLRGARARELFNADEVLVTARDLINDHNILVDHAVREVTYIHMLLPSHQVVFANNVATESFHPASAGLDTMDPDQRAHLFAQVPEIQTDPQAYGAYARRVLSGSEAAILRHGAA
ncbi:Hint domain-containing protein [Octadecabacter sp. SW4]|uniref:Hint domain-containing protein n=1 Tax=Octadecabacter sp. SW4 TaxID=2602067 RepID=UPI0011C1F2EF|nr:Hint domain-containing protein [Octadecabacter sp. SW4]QEE36601.1 Hint domain-containing protein [Octadecabacter sp. SW4]